MSITELHPDVAAMIPLADAITPWRVSNEDLRIVAAVLAAVLTPGTGPVAKTSRQNRPTPSGWPDGRDRYTSTKTVRWPGMGMRREFTEADCAILARVCDMYGWPKHGPVDAGGPDARLVYDY